MHVQVQFCNKKFVLHQITWQSVHVVWYNSLTIVLFCTIPMLYIFNLSFGTTPFFLFLLYLELHDWMFNIFGWMSTTRRSEQSLYYLKEPDFFFAKKIFTQQKFVLHNVLCRIICLVLSSIFNRQWSCLPMHVSSPPEGASCAHVINFFLCFY